MKRLKSTKRLTSAVSLVCSLLLLIVASSTWGRCETPTIEESFDESDFVFSGTVSQIDEQDENEKKVESDMVMLTVHFTLDKKWKGTGDNNTIEVTARSDYSRTHDYHVISGSLKFAIGDNYLIFAKRIQDFEESDDPEELYTAYCYGNMKLDELSESKALFAQLEELQSKMQEESEEVHDEESQVQQMRDSI